MDAARVTVLRELLAGSGWLERTQGFAGALRGAVTRPAAAPGGLLLVGTDAEEPWHLAAHLDDEAAWSGLPELSPTLLRRTVPPGAPPHLSVPLRRLEQAGRGETVLLVAPGASDGGLLERVHGARRSGATVLALEAVPATAGGELRGLAHESLIVPDDDGALDFDVVQHLVSAAAGEPSVPARRGRVLRGALTRTIERLTAAPPPMRW
ncbi:hypothetical protein [Streptacidiphilus carbonis]|uniref:hypothetical protein n=1 Tax=Streptacidiphilus carbonis TaxID=105422 RepID=UPI0005A7C146|nr:hypothetical protein [Streptacidiphilus carbonis]